MADKDMYRLDAVERNTIVRALKKTKRDKIAAGRLLEIGKTTIYRKLREYGWNPV